MNPKILELQDRVNEARKREARAEAQYEQALSQRDAALKALKEEFGLDNISDARAKLAELQQTLDDQMQSIEKILDEID